MTLLISNLIIKLELHFLCFWGFFTLKEQGVAEPGLCVLFSVLP